MKPRVVIIGGGFGGLSAAKALGVDVGLCQLSATCPPHNEIGKKIKVKTSTSAFQLNTHPYQSEG